jgi:hypothetical protein
MGQRGQAAVAVITLAVGSVAGAAALVGTSQPSPVVVTTAASTTAAASSPTSSASIARARRRLAQLHTATSRLQGQVRDLRAQLATAGRPSAPAPATSARHAAPAPTHESPDAPGDDAAEDDGDA